MPRGVPHNAGDAKSSGGRQGRPPGDRAPSPPVGLGSLDELRQMAAALSHDTAALNRELRNSFEKPTVAALNKLQAVVGEIEIASLLARRLTNDVHQHLKVPGLNSCSNEERLSHREREILRMLSRGWTVSEIAKKNALSVKTVSTYRVRVLHKLGFITTAQLMRYGISHHIDN